MMSDAFQTMAINHDIIGGISSCDIQTRECFVWVIPDGDRVMLPSTKFKTVDLVSGLGRVKLSNIKIFAFLPSCLFLPCRDATIAEEEGTRLIEAS
jgi:hypothetical protein